jgi:hypothetical protein
MRSAHVASGGGCIQLAISLQEKAKGNSSSSCSGQQQQYSTVLVHGRNVLTLTHTITILEGLLG